jgi:hypothetical protein
MLPHFFAVAGTALRWAPAAISLALLCACGSRNLRLVNPDTAPGPRYACWASVGCARAADDTDVSSELDPSETAVVDLPRECAGRIEQIVVLDSGSSKPKVYVTCAQNSPPGRPIEEIK